MQLWHCDDFLVATGVDKLVVDMEVDMVNPSLEKIKKNHPIWWGKACTSSMLCKFISSYIKLEQVIFSDCCYN